jgi:hypothetical protein
LGQFIFKLNNSQPHRFENLNTRETPILWSGLDTRGANLRCDRDGSGQVKLI